MKKLKMTPDAVADAIEAWVHLAEDNMRAADDFDRALRKEFDRLCLFPESSPLYPGYGSNIRGTPVWNYMVLYHVTETKVVIDRIIHGARDIEAEFRHDKA